MKYKKIAYTVLFLSFIGLLSILIILKQSIKVTHKQNKDLQNYILTLQKKNNLMKKRIIQYTKDTKKQLSTPKSVNCKIHKCISLTFDDGPSELTNKLLKILAKHNIQATFFVLGHKIKKNKELLREMSILGHEIANHSKSHPNFGKLSKEEIKKEILFTNQGILEATGKPSFFFRPPYGSHSNKIDKIINMPIVMRTIDPKDWKTFDAHKISKMVINNAHRNGIILLHDLYESTIDAVPIIIEELQAKGYTFVPIGVLKQGV